jgi:hypothetical protein
MLSAESVNDGLRAAALAHLTGTAWQLTPLEPPPPGLNLFSGNHADRRETASIY